MRNRTSIGRTRPLLVAMTVVLVAGGAAAAAGSYDANNAHKVDGFHAVGSKAGPAKRAGKLVATDRHGRLPRGAMSKAPNSQRLGGYTHTQMSTMSIAPQSFGIETGATMGSGGPSLGAAGGSGVRVSFVVPPDHAAGTPVYADIVYREDSPGACSWSVSTSGLEGPDGPNDVSNIHNGAWYVPGTTGYSGTISVPAGAGNAHTATFEWPFTADPGMFIQFGLSRDGAAAADTCGSVTIYGMQIRY